ncbi:MAG: hypothetical protein HYZ51_04810 [Candidatus Doudnabacteria bacterium]|nr:hypothetical protein [Candidatus Doudnabacteria bacterium]
MKIITLNCWLPLWSLDRKERLPFIFSALQKESPDIIFLQEVFLKQDAKYLIEKLEEVGFKESFHSKDLLFLSKYPIVSSEQRKLNNWGSFLVFGLLERQLKNVYQIIKVNIDEELITFVNLHLLGPYRNTKIYQETREKQIQEICENFSAGQDKIIMGGDFNFDMNTPSYDIVTKYFHFNDTFIHTGAPTFSISNSNIKKYHFFKKMMQKISNRGLTIFLYGDSK